MYSSVPILASINEIKRYENNQSKYVTLKCNYEKFSIDTITENSNILSVGRRESGKSFLVENILRSKNMKNKDITLICSINQANSFYTCLSGLKIKKIHYEYNSKIIKNIVFNREENKESIMDNISSL